MKHAVACVLLFSYKANDGNLFQNDEVIIVTFCAVDLFSIEAKEAKWEFPRKEEKK